MASPSDPAFRGLGLDDLCLSMDEGIYGEVSDATRHTRGQAIAFFAREAGCSFTEVKCRVRWLRLYTRQDAWETGGMEWWADHKGVELEDAPDVPPDDWQPSEGIPAWEFCDKSARGARMAYVMEQLPYKPNPLLFRKGDLVHVNVRPNAPPRAAALNRLLLRVTEWVAPPKRDRPIEGVSVPTAFAYTPANSRFVAGDPTGVPLYADELVIIESARGY